MKVRVLLFAQASELLGAPEIEIDFPRHGAGEAAPCAGELLAAIAAQAPSSAAAAVIERSAVAINEAYASRHDPINSGDVIAIIPPVSGG